MKTQILIAALITGAASANATFFDLGPNGTYYEQIYNLSVLNGTQLNGQTVSVDLNFGVSIYLFGNTLPTFGILINFQTNDPTYPGFVIGGGFLLDDFGNPVCGTRVLGSADGSDGTSEIGLFPLLNNDGNLATDFVRPDDFYGVHFDLTLPKNSAFSITSGSFYLFADDVTHNGNRSGPFRIGPHVPENGTTLSLLFLGIIALMGAKRRTQ